MTVLCALMDTQNKITRPSKRCDDDAVSSRAVRSLSTSSPIITPKNRRACAMIMGIMLMGSSSMCNFICKVASLCLQITPKSPSGQWWWHGNRCSNNNNIIKTKIWWQLSYFVARSGSCICISALAVLLLNVCRAAHSHCTTSQVNQFGNDLWGSVLSWQPVNFQLELQVPLKPLICFWLIRRRIEWGRRCR